MGKKDGYAILHRPPITSGAKYHVFLLMNWKMCKKVVRPNATTKMIAAIRFGMYRYRT